MATVMIPQINKIITDKLFLQDPGLIGCRRRGKWSQYEDQPWRMVRGNSLLAIIGDKIGMQTPVGELEFFMAEFTLLQYRGGPWNLDWVEDMYDLWSLVWVYDDEGNDYLDRTIIVLHENKSELDIKEVAVPDSLNPEIRADFIIKGYNADPPVRIPKSGERALRICPRCPHKVRCDAEDKLRGQDQDWSSKYPIP